MAAVARTLLQMQDVSRDLYLFDTFEGMSEPTASDLDYTGRQATEVMRENSGYKCVDAPLELVMEVVLGTGIPRKESILFKEGWRTPYRVPRRTRFLCYDWIQTGMYRPSTNWFNCFRAYPRPV